MMDFDFISEPLRHLVLILRILVPFIDKHDDSIIILVSNDSPNRLIDCPTCLKLIPFITREEGIIILRLLLLVKEVLLQYYQRI